MDFTKLLDRVFRLYTLPIKDFAKRVMLCGTMRLSLLKNGKLAPTPQDYENLGKGIDALVSNPEDTLIAELYTPHRICLAVNRGGRERSMAGRWLSEGNREELLQTLIYLGSVAPDVLAEAHARVSHSGNLPPAEIDSSNERRIMVEQELRKAGLTPGDVKALADHLN